MGPTMDGTRFFQLSAPLRVAANRRWVAVLSRRLGFCLLAAGLAVLAFNGGGAVAGPADTKAGAKPDVKPAPKPDAEPNPVKPAEKPAQHPVGYLIRVPVPIQGNVDTRIRADIAKRLARVPPGGPRPVVIFEFSPGQEEAGKGSDFGRSLELARFIATGHELSGVKTVAYIPKTIKGHAVLVALACEEIVMAPTAQIGEAGIDESTIGPTIRAGYTEIANARKTVPLPIALGMLDKELKVLKVTTDLGTDFCLSTDLDELKKHRAVQKTEELTPRPGLYSGDKARSELGFVSYLADDRSAVARAFNLPPQSLRDDPSMNGGWKAIQVPVKGVITPALVTETIKKIKDKLEDRVNFVCVWIDSAGGKQEDVMRLATYLASLNADKVRTVAYIPARARGYAALVALSCDQIVMGPDALLGGSGDFELAGDKTATLARTVRDSLAKSKNISWSLPVAMADPSLKVYEYANATDQHEYLSEDEAARLPKDWRQGVLITTNEAPLRVKGHDPNGIDAEKLGLAYAVVDNFTEFKQVYGLENDPELVQPRWADFLVAALSSRGMLGLLLFLGLAGVFFELNSPGTGIGGFVALVAFMLYFWIEHLQGTANWLTVLLFLAGVGCLLLEIFVLPGLAIFGLGGGLMVIASLILASQTFIVPQNDYQWEQMQNTVLTIGGAVVGAIGAGIIMRRLLPRTPMLNRMFLEPPSGAERQHIATREALVDFSHLVGRTGTTTTPLMPSGKARFGEELIDVIADGEPIDRGASVVVVEVRGNRVLVQPAA